MWITPSARGLRTAAALLALSLVVAGCGSGGAGGADGGDPGATDTTAGQQAQQGFSVAVASYDVAVSQEARRFLLGLQSADNRLVTHGSVELEFAYLGDREQQVANPDPSMAATAEFLPIPGSPDPGAGGGPRLSAPSEVRGVYSAQVAFDQAGFWTVAVSADIEGEGELTGSASFEVLADSQVPDVGEEALQTQNLTIDDVGTDGVTPVAVDSRAQNGGEVPNPELHDATIAEGIAAGRPVVALFATPVYCVSQFCGPITEMVASVAPRYADRVEFVHVEIWRDFNRQAVNQAAADWLLRGGNLQEPWLFVIGADGTITHRFDNVTTQPELEEALAQVA